MAPRVVGHRTGKGDFDELCRFPLPHTTYEVACGSTTVLRRHSSFEDLRLLLEMSGLKGVPLVPAKGSVVLRRVLPKRRTELVNALNAWLVIVVAMDPLLTSVELRVFLGLPRHSKVSTDLDVYFLTRVSESGEENDLNVASI